MWIVISDLKVIVPEIKNIPYVGIQMKCRKWSWFARELLIDGIELVVVDVSISRSVHEVADFKSRHLRHHVHEKCITCDIERKPEEDID